MGVKIGQNDVNFPYNKIYIGSNLVYELNTIITFTIGGISYQAEEGMTWNEWVFSEYNDINVYTTSESYNALLRACRVGSFEIAKYLVDNGADVFHKGEHDTSCLMLAAEYGDEKLVNFLIDKGCNVCERDYWGHNALDNAKKNGNRMVFRIIENKMIEENKKEKVQEKGGFLGKIFGGFGR